MNFSYLKDAESFFKLYNACCEAEEFALIKPDISASSARKAMEFIVKYIYGGIEPYPPYGTTVYDMISDSRFRDQFADPAMLESIDVIRKVGNTAVHQGNLIAEDSLRILEHLHFLTGEFAVGVGLIDDYPSFVPPKLNRIGEQLNKVHYDNFSLNILPYLRAAGHDDWGDILSECKKCHIGDLVHLPDELDCDAFLEFLKGFERSQKAEVDSILESLPLSPATENEWKTRRVNVPHSAIAQIECYVASYIEDNRKPFTQQWTYYNQALGDKAHPFLYLIHPDYIPESMRYAYVKPDAADLDDSDGFIPIDEAVRQLIRHIAGESTRKRDLLNMESWCKTNLSIPFQAIRSGYAKNNQECYSRERLHLGDKKYGVYLNWDRNSLMRLRQHAGELGEKLITLDRLADWGFADPGSPAAERAKLRAEKRKALEDLEKARQLKKEADKTIAEMEMKVSEKIETEVSPVEIRSYLTKELVLQDWLTYLSDADWCKKNLGMDYPVLISYEKRKNMLVKQKMRGESNYIYSAVICEVKGKDYFVKRMKESEFKHFVCVMAHFKKIL